MAQPQKPEDVIKGMRRQGAVIPNNIVQGFVRSDGTFVKPHIRFSPIPVRKRPIARVIAPPPPALPVTEDAMASGHDQPSWTMKDAAPIISCRNCYFFNWSKPGTCDAFPSGIPDEIAYGRVVHSDRVEGDNGVVFENWTRKIQEEQSSFPNDGEEAT